MPTPTPQWGDCVKEGIATLSCVPAVFRNVINAALLFAGVIALLMIIFSGFKFMTSSADPKKVEGARGTLVWAIIGLILILFAFGILNFISYVTAVPCILQFGFGNCG